MVRYAVLFAIHKSNEHALFKKVSHVTALQRATVVVALHTHETHTHTHLPDTNTHLLDTTTSTPPLSNTVEFVFVNGPVQAGLLGKQCVRYRRPGPAALLLITRL